MDVRTLRYFIAVAEHRSFSRAAENVGVVQSAISHAIRDLEAEVDTPLFHREGRSVRPTEAGQLLLEDARQIVRMVGHAKSRLKRLAAGEVGNLSIGFQAAACRRPTVSESLNDFRTRYPAIDLELSPLSGLAMENALQQRQLDGGFFYFEGNSHLRHRRLYVDDWALALPKSHRLASAAKLRLKDLQHENFIILPRKVNPRLNDRFLAAWSAGGLSPKIVQEAFEEPMVLNLVAVGLGVAFVLDSAPTELHGNIVLKRVSDFRVPVELCFVWNPSNRNPALARFLDIVDRLMRPGE